MDLVRLAYERGLRAADALSRDERKLLGQFMTPPSIARTMAKRACAGIEKAVVRILDPAAGSGVLAAAAVDALLESETRPSAVEVVLYEVDRRMLPTLRNLVGRLRRAARRAGVSLKAKICICDFLLSKAAVEKKQFDLIIANPPYFKLNKQDPRSQRHSDIIHGQPNIYGLFMAVCARILVSDGRWCFITPRSWTNGMYFTSVRRQLLRWLKIDAIHIFESRREHFTDDEILQEAMITWASAQTEFTGSILVSTSEGTLDLPAATLKAVPVTEVIGGGNQCVISLPLCDGTHPLRRFSARLATYGIAVSTGPVVAFRAAKYISGQPSHDSVPLLWMQHIHHMLVSWPVQKKREYIRSIGDTAWMLVPNVNMVLLRRFSPKEADRRMTAAPYVARSIPGDTLGLENHTNYIYRPGGELTSDEVIGLAAYLNSRIVDSYLREIAGNTQVNATDLRSLPLPDHEVLTKIGGALGPRSGLSDVDRVVDSSIRNHLIARVA